MYLWRRVMMTLCYVVDVDECQNDTWIQAFCPSPSVCINTPGYYECQRTLGLSKSGEQESVASGTLNRINKFSRRNPLNLNSWIFNILAHGDISDILDLFSRVLASLNFKICPPASPQCTGPWNGNASAPHGNHPKITSISHFSSIFKCAMTPASSQFWFLTLIYPII